MRRFIYNTLLVLGRIPFIGQALAIILLCSSGAIAGVVTANGLRALQALARRVPVSHVPAAIDARFGADAPMGYIVGAAPIAVMGLVILAFARWLAGEENMPRLILVPWDWWGVLIVIYAVAIVVVGVITPSAGAWMTSDGPAQCFFEMTTDCLNSDTR